MTTTKAALIACLLACTCLQPAPLAAAPVQQKAAKPRLLTDAALKAGLESLARDLAEQGHSGFIALERGDGLSILVPMGAANPANDHGYDLDTQFDIGSISKSITGLAASQLVATGRLDPQARLGDFFKDAPSDKAGISIEQLLTHTAGLGEAHGFDLNPMSRDEFLREAFAKPLIAPPGDHYAYSNTGLSFIAAIIEKVTGKPFDDYLVEDVLVPLGLNSTGYNRVYDAARIDANAQRGPVREASWGGLNDPSWALVGNGGMISSARDLLRLGAMVRHGGMAEGTSREWLTPRVSEDGGDVFAYGYGIGIQHHPQFGEIVWHNGGNPAFQTEWWNLMDHDATLLIHLNDKSRGMRSVLRASLGTIFGIESLKSAAEPTQNVDLGPIPDGPVGSMLSAFVAALTDGDIDARRAFITAYLAPALLEQMPMDQHLGMFEMIGQDVAGKRLIGAKPAPDGYRLIFVGDQNEPLQLIVAINNQSGSPKLIGIGIE